MRLNTYEDVVRGSMHFDLIVFRSDMLKMSEDDLDVRHRLSDTLLMLSNIAKELEEQ
jgi:hypothetical protein